MWCSDAKLNINESFTTEKKAFHLQALVGESAKSLVEVLEKFRARNHHRLQKCFLIIASISNGMKCNEKYHVQFFLLLSLKQQHKINFLELSRIRKKTKTNLKKQLTILIAVWVADKLFFMACFSEERKTLEENSWIIKNYHFCVLFWNHKSDGSEKKNMNLWSIIAQALKLLSLDLSEIANLFPSRHKNNRDGARERVREMNWM